MSQLRLGYLNTVMVIGRLVADPELRYTQKGSPVCDFRIACSRRYKNRETGEFQEDTLFINIVAWRRQAELVNDYLKKGSAVLIEGRLRSRQWESNQGGKRSVIEIVAHRIQFLDLPSTDTGESTIEVEEEAKEQAEGDSGDTPF
jgi:single-strand DNA-binding protein